MITMTTPATITAMADITTVTITIITVIHMKQAHSRGGEWAGQRCWWRLP